MGTTAVDQNLGYILYVLEREMSSCQALPNLKLEISNTYSIAILILWSTQNNDYKATESKITINFTVT